MPSDLILKQFKDVEKTTTLLRASIEKYVVYDIDKYYTPDELEYYDSLSFRFEKCVEMILGFFRTLEIHLYSKQSDTLRDRLLMTQKINIIKDIDFWMEARLLRNRIAHTYIPEETKDIYQEIHDSAKEIFDTTDRIKNYLANLEKEPKEE